MIPVSGLDIIVALTLTFIILRRPFATGDLVNYTLVATNALFVILWQSVRGNYYAFLYDDHFVIFVPHLFSMYPIPTSTQYSR